MHIKSSKAHFVLKLQGEHKDRLPEKIRVNYSTHVVESPRHQSHHDIVLPVKSEETVGDFAKRIVLAIYADATKKPEAEKTEPETETEG